MTKRTRKRSPGLQLFKNKKGKMKGDMRGVSQGVISLVL